MMAMFPLYFYGHFPILLILVSLVYSATRYEEWGAILREAWRWGIRMAVFLLAIAAALFVLALLLGT
jgi:hypothetical protein